MAMKALFLLGRWVEGKPSFALGGIRGSEISRSDIVVLKSIENAMQEDTDSRMKRFRFLALFLWKKAQENTPDPVLGAFLGGG